MLKPPRRPRRGRAGEQDDEKDEHDRQHDGREELAVEVRDEDAVQLEHDKRVEAEVLEEVNHPGEQAGGQGNCPPRMAGQWPPYETRIAVGRAEAACWTTRPPEEDAHPTRRRQSVTSRPGTLARSTNCFEPILGTR